MKTKTETRTTRHVKPRAIIRHVQFIYHSHTVTIENIVENIEVRRPEKPLVLGYIIKLARLNDNFTA